MKTKLIILILLNMVYTQDVTLTFDCPEEVTAGSENNHLYINMDNSVTLAWMEFNINSTPNELITFQDADWLYNDIYILFSTYQDSIFLFHASSPGAGEVHPPNSGQAVVLTFDVGEHTGIVDISFDNVLAAIVSTYEYSSIDFSDNCTISITEPLPDVYLGFGELDNENQTIEFIMNNSVDVAGIQFSLIGITVGNDIYELGGSAVDNDFWSSTNGHTILISLLGAGGIIPPSNGPLMYFSVESIDSTEACIIDPILSDDHGDGLTIEIGPCISTGPDCPTAFSSNFEEFNDINADGSLNISDIVIIVNCIFEAETTYDCQCGDIDEDGETNIIDIVYLVNILLMEN